MLQQREGFSRERTAFLTLGIQSVNDTPIIIITRILVVSRHTWSADDCAGKEGGGGSKSEGGAEQVFCFDCFTASTQASHHCATDDKMASCYWQQQQHTTTLQVSLHD